MDDVLQTPIYDLYALLADKEAFPATICTLGCFLVDCGPQLSQDNTGGYWCGYAGDAAVMD